VTNWWDGLLLRSITNMKLRTLHTLGSGNQVIQIGTIVRISGYQTRWDKLDIESDPCPHCGNRVRMSRVSRVDLEKIS